MINGIEDRKKNKDRRKILFYFNLQRSPNAVSGKFFTSFENSTVL